MKKIFILIPAVLFLFSKAFSQFPVVTWQFDTHDASYGQTAAGDIDRDGKLELVFGCYRNDSCVYALNAEDGSLLWKVNTHPNGAEGCNDAAPVLYDVDNDDTLEVIVASSCNPTTFCLNGRTGAVKWQTPTYGADSPPSIADIDHDGKPEILHGEFGGYVICINGEDGSVKWNIPVDTNSWIQTAPTIVDLDGDGQLDFVVATWNSVAGDTNRIYAFRGNDHSLMWKHDLDDVVYHGTAVADLDGDGKPELILGDYSGRLYVLNGEDGSLKWDYMWASDYYIGSPVVAADIDNDGLCELIFSSWFKIIALNNDSTELWDYTIPNYAQCFRGVAVSDVNGDVYPDVVFGTDDGKVIALNGLNGSPLWTIDLAALYGDTFEIDNAPVIADFDGNNIPDVFIVGGHGEYPNFQNDYGRAYAISVNHAGNGPDWLMFQHDIRRTSSMCYDTTTAVKPPAEILAESFTVNPNPAGTRFLVSVQAKPNEPLSLEIFNITGHLLYKKILQGNEDGKAEKNVSVSELGVSAGRLICIKITGEKFQKTEKVIIK